MPSLKIEKLWAGANFKPNPKQEAAIRHINGPLFLTAGPGSGKTRVLLWRTLNLIVFHEIDPKDIFLSTFTEKAARQLKDGLTGLLGLATNFTNKPYDISRMYVGTVHSNCQRIIGDRRFAQDRQRQRAPVVKDQLGQYFLLYNKRYWNEMLQAGGLPTEEDGVEAHRIISQYFNGRGWGSRHDAVLAITAFFNRLSEEYLDPKKVKTKDASLRSFLNMYDYYLSGLNENDIKTVDLSLLQSAAFNCLCSCEAATKEFKHVIIDEYQDTNNIQEKIFFQLAKGNKNICVVGDDDQALYRFRGATVENLVEFENRCNKILQAAPVRIDLNTNYRSRKQIVEFYTTFINHIDWRRKHPQKGAYRIIDKEIKPFSTDKNTSVLVSTLAKAPNVYAEIAAFVKKLKSSGKIEDYNQCAFLFPAMKANSRVEGFHQALEDIGIPVYAPRAGNFFELEEVQAMLGCMLRIFDRPHYGSDVSAGINNYRRWLINCMATAGELVDEDNQLRQFITDKKIEIGLLQEDYEVLIDRASRKKWDLREAVSDEMIRILAACNISDRAKKNMTSGYFLSLLKRRRREGRPVTLEYVINRATSLDWSVLDLFYQLCSFTYFRTMFDLAESGRDEGFVCNLSMLSEYLGRYLEERSAIITAASLNEQKFQWSFFGSYFYALYRLGQSEYEDEEVPFPKGRVPFLTIHQSKGLEFPVVVLGSLFKTLREADACEIAVRQLTSKAGEPLDRMPTFDLMRMFYVGLSRAENLLVLPRYKGGKNACDVFKELIFSNQFSEIKDFKMSTLPNAKAEVTELGKNYSYTADFLNYQRCPRQYMLFRKYGFVTSRSQNQYFGTLVHQTIEDLHHLLKLPS